MAKQSKDARDAKSGGPGKDTVYILQETYEGETCNTGAYMDGEALIEGLAEAVADIFFANRYADTREPSAEEKELARAVALAVYDFVKLPCAPESRADGCRFSETVFGLETMEVVESSRDKEGK